MTNTILSIFHFLGIKVAHTPGFTVVTVTFHVLLIVKTVHATYKVERALHVTLDGLDIIVIQVR